MPANQHGVTGELIKAGDLFAGKVFVPDCCFSCAHFCVGEFGDFGNRLSPPECKVMLRFPTKKGTCKRQKTR
jgi:hypothetical protein